MAGERKHTLHRFEIDGRRFAIDPETCFCLECDAVSWAVFEHYPDKSFEEIRHLLGGQFPPREIEEVISEIEWLRAGGSLWPKLTPELLAKRYESTPTELSEIVVFPYEPPPARPMTGGNVQEKSASPVSVPGGWRRWFSGAQNDSALPDCAGNEITAARDLVMAAGNLLLARSGNARNLRLVLSIPSGMDPSLPWADAEPVLRNLVQAARLSDKKLSAGILQEGVAVNGEPCEWHWLLENDTGPEPVAEALKRLPKKKDPKAIAGWMESCETDTDSLHGQVWLTPNRADFSGLVRRWRQWGFRRIILRDAALAADLPAEHLELYVAGMRRNAEDYANDLLKSDLYLCEPFATWFRLIYAGEPSWRGDPAGTGRLAVNGQGTIYPDAEFMSGDASPLGRMGIGGGEAAWDADRASDFLDLGSMTMPSCLGCWARGLCGGGQALVHYRRSGSITRPDPSWCDARRRILEHVIAAFNTLSAAGIPFLDLHRALGRSKGGLSWRLLLRAVRGSVLAARPIRESDAPLLARWERWNPAAYFTFTDSGVLLATTHDRENDALHPKPWQMELALIRPGQDRPIGLLRLIPHRLPATVWAWLYLRDPVAYGHAGTRQGLRELINTTLRDRAVHCILTPAGPYDNGLEACLLAVGFTRAGVLRESLYLHGRYHHVTVFSYTRPDTRSNFSG